MTSSPFRVALILSLASGCAHPVYDGQPDFDDSSDTNELPVNVAGSGNVVNSLPTAGSGSAAGGAEDREGSGGTPGTSGATNGDAGKGAGGGSEAGGAPASAESSAGGTPASAGSHAGGTTSAGGSASAGSSSAGSSSSSAGSSSAGSSSAGSSSAGSGNDACSGVPAWSLVVYHAGDKVKSNGKLYKCKPYPYTGWCGLSDAYAPTSGFAWMDAWDYVGTCN